MSDRIDKLEAAVKKLGGEVGEVRTEVKAQGKRVDRLSEDVGHLTENVGHLSEVVDRLSEDVESGFSALTSSVKEIQRTQAALASAMTTAVKQLSVGKTLELRMQRLEDAVFGPKH